MSVATLTVDRSTFRPLAGGRSVRSRAASKSGVWCFAMSLSVASKGNDIGVSLAAAGRSALRRRNVLEDDHAQRGHGHVDRYRPAVIAQWHRLHAAEVALPAATVLA